MLGCPSSSPQQQHNNNTTTSTQSICSLPLLLFCLLLLPGSKRSTKQRSSCQCPLTCSHTHSFTRTRTRTLGSVLNGQIDSGKKSCVWPKHTHTHTHTHTHKRTNQQLRLCVEGEGKRVVGINKAACVVNQNKAREETRKSKQGRANGLWSGASAIAVHWFQISGRNEALPMLGSAPPPTLPKAKLACHLHNLALLKRELVGRLRSKRVDSLVPRSSQSKLWQHTHTYTQKKANGCVCVVSRHISSAQTDSFYNNLLDAPYYTNPRELDGMKVPDVLLSGDHKKIKIWKNKNRKSRTMINRPDLWNRYINENKSEIRNE